jgi:ABC-type transport system substrate-binding protein/class 3 adenylate cyclase
LTLRGSGETIHSWWRTSERLSGTVTFLFSDIEGSTALLKLLGRDRYGELLARHQVLLRQAFAEHRGEEIDTQGDAFFVAFRSASDAVAAAVAIQRALAAEPWPGSGEVRVRIGIHSGEASASGKRYVGFSVHRAARVGALGHGGQVLLSETARHLVEDDLPDGLTLRDLGLFRLKDIERPERITQLVVTGLPSDFPPPSGATEVEAAPVLRRRSLLATAVVGVVAAAVAIPLFALGGGTSGSTPRDVQAPVTADAVGIFDSSRARLIGQAQLGTEPSAVAAGSRDVWVASIGDDAVTRVDSETRTRLQTVSVGNSPSAVTVADGFVWVANSLDGTVSKIDPNAGGGGGAVVDTIPVGNGPAGVAVGAGRLWVANSTDRTVMEFRPGSHQSSRTFGLPQGADGVAYGFGLVWVMNSAGNSVTRIVPGTGAVLPAIGVGNDPRAIAAGAGAVWVANSLDGTVSRIDPGDASVEGIAVGGSPAGIAVSDGAVWVADGRTDVVSRIDLTARKVVQTMHVGSRVAGVAAAGNSLFVAAATTGRNHRGGTLRVSTPVFDTIDAIDPAIAFEKWEWQVLSLTNDGLVTYQRVGGSDGARLVPDLATSIPSPADGGLTYTFQLRRGIRYSTGALVRPTDVRRAIERSLAVWHQSSDPSATTGFYFAGLDGAKACTKTRCDLSRGIVIDPVAHTLTFHLVAPDPDFLFKLATSSAYAVPANAPLKPDLHLPATGPYMVARYRPGRDMLLVRNPHFRVWNTAAQPDGFPDRILGTFRPYFSAKQAAAVAAAVRAVRDGRLDYTDDAADAAPSLRRDGFAGRLHVEPTFNTNFIELNTRVAPFDNAGARQAVNESFDHQLAARLEPGGGVYHPTCQVLPPNLAGYVRYCPYTGDLARARRLVAASATAGQVVTVVSAPGQIPLMSYVRRVLQRLGYRARLHTFKNVNAFFNYYSNVESKGRGFQVRHGGWNADYPSAFDFFHPLLTCPDYRPRTGDYSNLGGFCDHAIDRAIANAASLQSSDPQAAAALWSTIDHRITNAAPWIAIGNQQEVDFVSGRVGNYQYNPQWGALLDQLWVR